jgi:hypothetical protein
MLETSIQVQGIVDQRPILGRGNPAERLAGAL